jgi:hypothetical protein
LYALQNIFTDASSEFRHEFPLARQQLVLDGISTLTKNAPLPTRVSSTELRLTDEISVSYSASFFPSCSWNFRSADPWVYDNRNVNSSPRGQCGTARHTRDLTKGLFFITVQERMALRESDQRRNTSAQDYSTAAAEGICDVEGLPGAGTDNRGSKLMPDRDTTSTLWNHLIFRLGSDCVSCPLPERYLHAMTVAVSYPPA